MIEEEEEEEEEENDLRDRPHGESLAGQNLDEQRC